MKKLLPKQPADMEPVVMVCVTRQRTCARLIARGEEIAHERNCRLHVVHAVRTGENFLGNALEGDALEYLHVAAQLSGGELTVLRTDDAEGAIAEYARSLGASVLVLGHSPDGRKSSFIGRIERSLPHVRVVVE